jgi:hypothetical protein
MPGKDCVGSVTFCATIHRQVTDREGEVTLTLRIPASDAPLAVQAALLLTMQVVRVTLAPEDED